jgi:hypothetical protein
MAAYYKVEVTLNSQAVSVGLPSPQSVSVTIPLIGPQGPVGATGSTGATGPANSLAIGAVSTGAAGSNASATITGTAPSQTLDLTIPRGDKGDTGDTGATGPANSLAIGTVSTGAAGSNADATITGTAPNQTLNLTIPVGATGATGPTGPQGPTIADANAPATNNILWQIRTTAFTAASGGRYVASGTFTVTNPASGNDGELFQVVVASGTVTVNSVAYGASRWPVTVARISGAWTTLPNTLTENLTLNGTNNTAPNQTAASGSSIMTRDLSDARTISRRMRLTGGVFPVGAGWLTTNSGTGAAIQNSAALGARVNGGTGTNSFAILRGNGGALNAPRNFDFSKRIFVSWRFALTGLVAGGSVRMIFGGQSPFGTDLAAAGALQVNGIGILIDNTDLKIETRSGATLTTSSSLATLSVTTMYVVVLESDGAGSVSVTLNDTSIGTATGAPTSASGTSDAINVSAINTVNGSAGVLVDVSLFGFEIIS